MADDKTIGINRRMPSITDGKQTQTLADDEDTKEVDLAESEGDPADEDDFNMVKKYSASDDGKKFLEDVSDIVMDSFKSMWESTEEYREKRAQLYRLFRGNLTQKSAPFEDCANIHMPVVLQAIAMLVPRVITEIFPADDYIFKAVPTGPEDQERADVLTQHGDWQFKHEISDFIPQFERAVTESMLVGTAIVYSCRDTINNRNNHRALSCEDLVMSYTVNAVDPSLADVPEKIMIVRWSRHELEDLVAQGKYDSDAVGSILEPLDDPKNRGSKAKQDEPTLTVRESVEEVEGHVRPENDPTAPYVFYEYHGWLKLPGEERQRPVVAVVETSTRKIASFYLREDDDWRDKERYDREIQDIASYQQAVEQFRAAAANPQLIPGPDGMPTQAPIPDAPIPPPSVKLDEAGEPLPPEQPRKVAIEYFTRIDCIYDPHGSMGIGIGDMVKGFNEMVNQLGNLFTDAASIANSPPQLVSENALPPGEVEIGPGAIIRSPLPPEQLDKAQKTLIQTQGNPQLLEMMNLLMGVAKEVAATPDVYSGQPGKAGETYRGISTRVQEAAKPLTAVAQRILRGLTEIVRKNARLNSIFLPEEDIVNVIDPSKGRMKVKITRAIYLEDYDITFTADTRFTSQAQKLDEDVQLMQFAATSPLFAGNQIQQQVFLFEVASRYLKDMKRPELIPYLGQRPQPPPPPQPIAPPDENAMFLEGKAPNVHPADDDPKHVADHNAFMSSQEAQYLAPDQHKNLEQHVRNHVAAHIQKVAKATQEMTNAAAASNGSPGPGGDRGMAPGGANPGPPAQA